MATDIDAFLEDCKTNCQRVVVRKFSKGEVVTTYIDKRNQICILNYGEADLIRYDSKGYKTILKHFSTHDTFGEAFYPAKTNNELFVTASKPCEVTFLNYDIMNQKCRSNCKFHSILTKNINDLILNQIISLNTRIEVLSQKTIRDKLLSYFNILSNQGLNKNIKIPFSLTDLADFLSVDRSSMSRELSNLKKEGFIVSHGHGSYTLKY